MGSRAWSLLVLPIVYVGASPNVADACTCGATATGLGRSEPRPANGLVGLTHCDDDLPIDQISVTVDGEPAQLLDAGVEVGSFGALYEVEPPPGEGQTVALHVCEGDELCIVFSPSSEWVVAAEDHEPPGASASAVLVETALVEDDGISCGPFGPRFLVTIEEPVFDIDVAAIRADVLRDGVVVDGRLGILPADGLRDGEPVTLVVHADTSAGACVRALAMDAAGNATMLGSEVCDPSPVVEDTTSGATEAGEIAADGGCGCRPGEGRGHWPLAALLLPAVAGVSRGRRAAGKRRRESQPSASTSSATAAR